MSFLSLLKETNMNLPLNTSVCLTLINTQTKYLLPLVLVTSAFATSLSPAKTGVLYFIFATPISATLASMTAIAKDSA